MSISSLPIRMTTAQASEYSGRHVTTIHKALEAGQLHGDQRKARGRWSIRTECVDAWLAGQQCPHEEPAEERARAS